ncbi:MAG: ribose-5-phosphate isomerase RpiA [Leptodesmis sp.]|uniref:ribose-5-phosphate isomerase RpiA n=1 Tax=Leptodesmis sp. TaxID=3100501 RepID=UPI003D09B4D9
MVSLSSESDSITVVKQAVGKAAARRVKSGAIVGLGTGSTTAFAIQYLGEFLRSGALTNIRGIPTSYQAAALARRYGIPLTTLDDVDRIDIAIDGADAVDPQKNLIKGGGAAHTQEKVVDSLADLFIVVVDRSKLVDHLGVVPVPVEVLPFAVTPTMRAIQKLGGKPEIRMATSNKDGPVITDQGNMVLDVKFDRIDDPGELNRTLNTIPGVVDSGLFVGAAQVVLVGEMQQGEPVVWEM